MGKLNTYGPFGRPYSRDFTDANRGEFLPDFGRDWGDPFGSGAPHRRPIT
jgi:hypothetical protein